MVIPRAVRDITPRATVMSSINAGDFCLADAGLGRALSHLAAAEIFLALADPCKVGDAVNGQIALPENADAEKRAARSIWRACAQLRYSVRDPCRRLTLIAGFGMASCLFVHSETRHFVYNGNTG